MSRLKVEESKKLVLKSVLIHELRNIEMDSTEVEIQKFLNQLKLLNVQTFGPLITKNYGVSIGENGSMSVSYDVMVQAHDFKQYKNTFRTSEKVTVENCVYLRFEDHPQYIQLAYSKLDLYFYEEKLDSDGTIYNVIVRDSEDLIIMDIFRPVVVL